MKVLKGILIVIAIVIAIPLIMGLFAKDSFSVEREVTINKPKQDVFNYIKLLKNQAYFSKWQMMDPNAKMDYTGTDGTVGFVSAWDSQDGHLGKGSQTITKIADGDRMDVDIHFIKPFEASNSAYFTTTSVTGNQTKVTWGFTGKLNYPMKVMHLFMNMDKMVGDDLQTGLNNLKGVLEK